MIANKKLTNACGQEVSVQSVDLLLYIPCEEIIFDKNEWFDNHVMRMGGFHKISSYNGSVGKLWDSTGLKDLLVQLDVYAEGTVDLILQEKEFNRGIRAYILAY